jgi:hypothetical protein
MPRFMIRAIADRQSPLKIQRRRSYSMLGLSYWTGVASKGPLGFSIVYPDETMALSHSLRELTKLHHDAIEKLVTPLPLFHI